MALTQFVDQNTLLFYRFTLPPYGIYERAKNYETDLV